MKKLQGWEEEIHYESLMELRTQKVLFSNHNADTNGEEKRKKWLTENDCTADRRSSPDSG